MADLDIIIENALKEDIGDGDHTSLAIFSPDVKGKACLRIKDIGILAGLNVAEKIFKAIDPELDLTIFMQEGSTIQNDDIVFEVKGRILSILSATVKRDRY
jgi:nicotinate-nucleotide pyrophosphorylase (carboxylating)